MSASGWRVVYDAQALQSAAHKDRGIGRYVRGHVAALDQLGAIDRLVGDPGAPRPAREDLPPALPMVPFRPRVMREVAADGPVLLLIASPFERGPADAVVTPHGVGWADAFAVVLHDVIPYVLADVYQPDRAQRSFYRRRAHLVQSADLVLTNSDFTRTDAISVLELDPDRVVTIGSGASSYFAPPAAAGEPAELLAASLPVLTGPFVLTVSGYEPRKDPSVLIDAFAALPPSVRDGYRLVIVCDLPPEGERAWRARAARAGLPADRLVLTGRVTDDVMRALYQRCALFVFSSRYEGFGLPVLEAARGGAPAITSDNSALPEVLDCPESTFPTGDARAITDAIARGLTDPARRDVLLTASARAARRHTWGAVADRTVAAFARLTPPAPSARTARGHRTAVCTPLPPSKSGVAVFTAPVLAELAREHAVDCFRDGPSTPRVPTDRAYRCFSASSFRTLFSPGSYDSLLYVLGNSHFHRRTLGHALAAPGVVWMHDASLVGLYLTIAGLYVPGHDPQGVDRDAARASMRAALERCAGPNAPDLGDAWDQPDAYARLGLTMTEEMLRAATAVIVTTGIAAATVRAIVPGTPVHVVPLPVSVRPPRRAAHSGEPLVVSLGWVDPIKRPLEVVDAFARANRSTPARLAFVGECAPFLADALRARAAEHGIADRVEITGFVDDPAAYDDWLARATCLVQLRRRTHGESSGALVDAIAAGVPVITSVASARELPAGVVDLVEEDAPVDEIASRLERLLGDADYRERMIATGADYASSWTARDAAAVVAGILASAER